MYLFLLMSAFFQCQIPTIPSPFVGISIQEARNKVLSFNQGIQEGNRELNKLLSSAPGSTWPTDKAIRHYLDQANSLLWEALRNIRTIWVNLNDSQQDITALGNSNSWKKSECEYINTCINIFKVNCLFFDTLQAMDGLEETSFWYGRQEMIKAIILSFNATLSKSACHPPSANTAEEKK